MFTRIVKMEFREEAVEDFLQNFDRNKDKIRAFPGCEFLELYRDKQDPSIFFTYSKWQQTSDLDTYRNSALFKSVWATTKTLFRSKPQAWSVDSMHQLN